jgi:hypothetical protein
MRAVGARILGACGLALALVLLLTLAAPRALAAANQQMMLEDDSVLMNDPAGTLASLRLLGVQRVRLAVRWYYIAPDPHSRRMPRHFNGNDPRSYPAANWAIWDEIVRDAAQDGIALDFNPSGGAPLWAEGGGAPRRNTNPNWEPSPGLYRQFVHALGVRYSGSYDPERKQTVRDANDLPRVSFWSVWNEPDYGPSLAPQGVMGHLTIPNSPRMYRNLVDAAWSALAATGHRHDMFIFGELAPRGFPFWGVYSGMKPITFMRYLYCVDSSYRPLTGAAAAATGCPTTATGSHRFRALNPGLFEASGISDHPYMRWYPPNREEAPDPQYTSLAEIGNLEYVADRLQRVYGSGRHLPIWDTEFAYITTPPKHDNQYEPTQPHHQPWPSQATASDYLNWAEYISWRNPRMASFFQYLLQDPLPSTKSTDWGGFASGLLSYSGRAKATYAAWRLPLYMPRTTGRRGHRLQVWGCVRPAHYALLDTGQPQTAEIQFAPRSGGGYRTLATLRISSSKASCYFDMRVSFPSSGSVRLVWSYPAGDPLLGNYGLSGRAAYSRVVAIRLR